MWSPDSPNSLSVPTTPNLTHNENDLFGVTTEAGGSTWAVGWAIYGNPSAAIHVPIVLHNKNGVWSLVSSPNLGAGSDSGFSAITSIPGGGMWVVGVTASANGSGNYKTLIEYHP